MLCMNRTSLPQTTSMPHTPSIRQHPRAPCALEQRWIGWPGAWSAWIESTELERTRLLASPGAATASNRLLALRVGARSASPCRVRRATDEQQSLTHPAVPADLQGIDNDAVERTTERKNKNTQLASEHATQMLFF